MTACLSVQRNGDNADELVALEKVDKDGRWQEVHLRGLESWRLKSNSRNVILGRTLAGKDLASCASWPGWTIRLKGRVADRRSGCDRCIRS